MEAEPRSRQAERRGRRYCQKLLRIDCAREGRADAVDEGVARSEHADPPAAFGGYGLRRTGEMEPVGNRIITVPVDQTRARLRDPRSGAGFIAYVPPGSISKGKALTAGCTICHGDNFKGLGNVPRLAGLHPIYVARQMYLFKDATRNGIDAQLMKKPVARLTDDDILAIAAYLGTL